jgi:hypothetical protein
VYGVELEKVDILAQNGIGANLSWNDVYFVSQLSANDQPLSRR